MMFRYLWLVALLVALIPKSAPAAISITSVTRSVDVSATGGVPLSFTSTSDGSYNANMNSFGPHPAGTIISAANQTSFVPSPVGSSMNGSARASAAATATGAAVYSINSNSSLDVFFTVTASQLYQLTAYVDWIGDSPPGPFGGVGRVQLMDVTNLLVPFDLQRDSMISGTATLSTAIPLSTGITYRLRADGKTFGGGSTAGSFTANANWDFTLQLINVPEPTSALVLLGVAIAAVAIRACAGGVSSGKA
jgi:hypothetical protein